MTKFHCIAGLPRSGSTLLAAILRQNPRHQASMMSPVFGMAMGLINSWRAGTEISPLVDKEQKRRLIKGLFHQYHGDGMPLVFDNNRGWAEKLGLIDDLFPDAKVICCVRSVASVLDSFERLYQQDPYEQTRLFPSDDDRSTVYTRVRSLARPNRVVGYAVQALKQAFYSQHSSKLLLIDYEYLAKEPELALAKLYQELEEPAYRHDFAGVRFDAEAFDANLGVPGLHRVRDRVELRIQPTLIPPDLFREFSGLEFWRDGKGSSARLIAARPEATEKHP